MPDSEELVRRRLDKFEQWWEQNCPTEGEFGLDDLWAMCRKAWYASRREALQEKS